MLDACLVTGFNPLSVASITVANNIATLTTTTNHGLNTDDAILISGAIESVFNNTFRILSTPTSTTLTFAVTTTSTGATGTITVKTAPLGWQKIFSRN